MKFDPLILFKAAFLFFIVLFAGVLVLLFKTHVQSIAAWVSVVLIIAFLICMYTIFFTNASDRSSRSSYTPHLDTLTYTQDGLEEIMPLMDTRKFIAWDNILSVLYDDRSISDSDDYRVRYTFYLESPPEISLTENPSRLNKLFGASGSKSSRVVYIDDKRNQDINTLKEQLPRYLANVNVGFTDSKRGTLITQDVKTSGNKREVSQTWKPEVMDYPFRLIYDKQGRSLREVLIANQMLSADD